MPVVPIGCNDVVILPENSNRPKGRCLLADVEVEKASHFPALIGLQGSLLKLPDPDHHPEGFKLLLRGHAGIDGLFRKGMKVLFTEGPGLTLLEVLEFWIFRTHSRLGLEKEGIQRGGIGKRIQEKKTGERPVHTLSETNLRFPTSPEPAVPLGQNGSLPHRGEAPRAPQS